MRGRAWRVVALAGAVGLGGCAGAPRARLGMAPAAEAEARLAEFSDAQGQPAPDEEEEQAERDAFARRAMEALLEAGEPSRIHYDPDGFLLRLVGQDEAERGTVFLSNFFEEYLVLPPEQREEVFTRLARIRARPALPDTFDEARPRLLPVVRGRTFFEQLRQLMKASSHESLSVAWRAEGSFLGVGLAFDAPDTLQYLGAEELTRWGVSFEQALAVALENLRQRSPEPLETLAPGTCESPWEDSYASSRLLLDEVVGRCPVRGEPVVLVPHRDVLLITGSEDEDGQRLVAERALQAVMAPRALDGRALRRAPEGWAPYMPERLSDAWAAFRKLELFTRARDYADQTQRLDKHFEDEGVELFVASFNPYQDERGRLTSYAVWVKGVDTLLPRTDLLFFMDPDRGPEAGPSAVARWDAVAREAGHLLEPVKDLYPERYHVRGFPTSEQLARWQEDPGDLLDAGEP